MKRIDDLQLQSVSRCSDRPRDLRVCGVVSMLHEEANANSVTRLFRDQPVLAWTLGRLAQVDGLLHVVVIAWEDQARAVSDICELAGATLISKGPRQKIGLLDAINKSRVWSDGWRGGLLGATSYDAGFHAPFIRRAIECLDCDHALVVNPASALIHPALLTELIERMKPPTSVAMQTERFAFNHTAPGTGAILLGPAVLAELERSHSTPASLLSYHPDRLARDPVATRACIAATKKLARTTASLLLDSDRQVDLIECATTNASLSDLDGVVDRVEQLKSFEQTPRDVTIELNTNRLVKPVWSILSSRPVGREPMSIDLLNDLAIELAMIPDVRVTIAGVGDPLLHAGFAQMVRALRAAGVKHIHVETDLLELREDALFAIIQHVDILSVHIPAMTAITYGRVMPGGDMKTMLDGLKRLLQAKQEANSSLPIVAPTFVKCRENQAEMEDWLDQWLRAVGSGVIRGATSLGGLIENVSPVDMAPPLRRSCRRLSSSVVVLSDGSVTACDQDVLGRQILANLDQVGLLATWRSKLREMHNAHDQGDWQHYPTCSACDQWDRPC